MMRPIRRPRARSRCPITLPLRYCLSKNLSGDADQRYFVDGIVEDIITELSKYRWLLVIARNTSFTFRDRLTDIKEVGRKLGVRYVMEGSIRRTGNQVRITAQLIDAQSGAHVWAEHFDRDLADVFAVQDEITLNVAGAIQPRLISAEADRVRSKPPESMAAWDYAVRGRWHVLRLSKEDNAEAQRLLREGLALYRNSVPILTFLSYSLTTGVIFGWSDDPERWLAEAKELAERAANLDENDAWVQCVLGLSKFTAKQPDKAIGHYRKAIALNPSFALGHGYLALQLAFVAGRTSEAIKEAETAIRLSPHDPELYHFFYAIGMAHFVAGRYDDAATWAERAESERPAGIGFGPLRLLASSYAHVNRLDDARNAFASVLEVTPRISATGIRKAIHFGQPEDLERYLDGLRKAGLRE
jgi:TolB-like protein